MTDTINVVVEFGGGLEMLFPAAKSSYAIPAREAEDDGGGGSGDGKPVTLGWLIAWLCREVMQDSRKEMFVMDDQIRPGVLVLINDADWALEGEAAYALQPDDNILFVSTLHGG